MEQGEEWEHHSQYELCRTRPTYRQGKKLTAVKVYTVADESSCLLIFGVPRINLCTELKNLCQRYGKIVELSICKNYLVEDFTECFKVKFERVQSSRIAKKMIDSKNFYGGSLHVCYGPEYETVNELYTKLEHRKLDVMRRIRINELDKIKNSSTIFTRKSEPDQNVTQRTLENSDSTNEKCTNLQAHNSLGQHEGIQHGDCICKEPRVSHYSGISLANLQTASLNNVTTTSSLVGNNLDEINENRITTSDKQFHTEKKINELEYVFKGKRRKKDKKLASKVGGIFHKSMIDNITNKYTTQQQNSTGGKIVVCDINSGISRNKIFHAPKRNM